MAIQCFQIITKAGLARSGFIEAIHKAKRGEFEGAAQLIAEGKKQFREGHKIHADFIQKEAAGQSVEVNLLLVHTEDQLLSAEQFQIIAVEFIDCYRIMMAMQANVEKEEKC